LNDLILDLRTTYDPPRLLNERKITEFVLSSPFIVNIVDVSIRYFLTISAGNTIAKDELLLPT